MTTLSPVSAVWQTMRFNRDWFRYLSARLIEPEDDKLLSFRLRTGQTVTMRGSVRSTLNEIYLHKVYDVPGVDFNKCRRVFDLGANMGLFALYVAAQAPQAEIDCVEASSANFPLLQQNLSANSERAHAYRMAVSTTCGPRRFSLAGGAGEYRLDSLASEHFEIVECVDLAGIFAMTGADVCDFLKMDIEGEELPLLMETPLHVLRRVRAMAMEWHYPELRLEPVQARLVNAGFETWIDRVGHRREQVMLKARRV
ncbi:MAG TPA: FkbM family methyltransferase [Burkholderiales bacterium]|nr:FkbM family methyltransferase [Burkholderiales bacterium]